MPREDEEVSGVHMKITRHAKEELRAKREESVLTVSKTGPEFHGCQNQQKRTLKQSP